MKQDSHTTSSWWSIGEWRLGWKVVAVLALPMLVAVILGAMRVQTELGEASKLSSSSERVLAIPAAVNLDSTLFDLGEAASSGVDTTAARNAVSAAADRLDEAGRIFDGDSTLSSQVDSAVYDSRAIRDEVAAGNVAPARLVSRIDEVTSRLASTFTDFVDSSQRPVMRDRGVELATLWDARRSWAEQRVLFGSGAPDQKTRADMAAAAGAELSALTAMSASLDANGNTASADTVKTLRAAAQTRIDDIGSTPADVPLSAQFGSGLQASKDDYTTVTDNAVDAFSSTVTAESNSARSAALRDTAIVLGAVLLALAIALVISRSLVGPIRQLRLAALQAARYGLPEAIDRIRGGVKVEDLDIARVPITTHEEIGELARAVDDMHGQAVTLAGEQASLRRQVSDMFETLSRRNKSLVEQQLGLIEQLEQDENDPRRLENLFRLDHIAARMRRNSENLLVLAGNEVRRARSAPIALADTIRAAVSGVEDYRRVELGQIPPGVVSGQAAPDVVHLVAELLDNALRYSPPETTVSVNAARTMDGSLIIEIADLGIGMTPAEILDANQRLASGGEMSPETARRMGLFVVSRISRRYDVSVRLRPTHTTPTQVGITATVLLPTLILESSPVTQIRAPRSGPAPTPDAPPAHAAQAPPSSGFRLPSSNSEFALRSAAGLPQRSTSGAAGKPGSGGFTSPPPSKPQGDQDAPRRDTPPASRAPESTPASGSALPRRTPGTSGVPNPTRPAPTTQNRPPAQPMRSGPPNRQTPAAAQQQRQGGAPAAQQGAPQVGGPQGHIEEPRHRLAPPTPTNTAAFFSSRARDGMAARNPNPAGGDATTAQPSPMPIYARMVSEWLVDPTAENAGIAPGSPWTTVADQGWVAARTSFEMPVTKITDAGLPVRDRGARLIPGTVGSPQPGQRQVSDPADVRRGWSNYQSGVQRGRKHAADRSAASGGAEVDSSTKLHNTEGEQ
ncbi:signal transduction histidine kinase [Rhodococcus sp. 27YEA15]|uniref:HAMP domain-containing sensor histidine kinase n=1 Tax=Rhodococcus sp. 27YEA15 TaxID=3156259 RepID=UPI003C7CE99F